MSNSVHFIGIGGIGMSGIAQILLRKGYRVSGSDLKENPNTQRLRKLGAKISLNHNPDNIGDELDLVVYSSAIKSGNPELKAAIERHIPVVKRAQILADLMQDKIGIAIAGAHGKTTTTSLASFLLNLADFFPTVIAGGVVINFNDNALLGDSPYFVAEMDESDGSFLYFNPTYSIVTNIDYEHVDFFRNWDNILNAYREFMNNTKPDGCLFACADDEHIRSLLKNYNKRYISFGLKDGCDIQAIDISSQDFTSRFNCIYRSKNLGQLTLNIPGKHNISNSLAVIGLGLELGISLEKIRESLSLFKGVERRLQIKSKINDITIVDDYGHHPTEIKATLEALSLNKPKRTIVIFQPHRYTRTKFLLDEFVESLCLADYLIITDIYPASEEPIEGVSAYNIYKKLKDLNRSDVYYLPNKEEIVERVLEIAKPGYLVVTLGAGDIGRITDELSSRFEKMYQGQGQVQRTSI